MPTAAPAAAMLWRQVETRLDQAASGLQSSPQSAPAPASRLKMEPQSPPPVHHHQAVTEQTGSRNSTVYFALEIVVMIHLNHDFSSLNRCDLFSEDNIMG